MNIQRQLIALALLAGTSFAAAQQPKWAKNARKATATLYALQQNGDTLQAQSFFTDAQGTALTSLKPLKSATRAWLQDEKGQQWVVSRICGINSTYNIAKIRVDVGKKKTAFLPVSLSTVEKDSVVYVAPYQVADAVTQSEKSGNYDFYTLQSPANPQLEGAPVTNASGEVVAILQVPLTMPKAPNYALSAAIEPELSFRGIDVNTQTLSQCRIAKQLPADYKEATTFLFLCNRADSLQYAQYVDDYMLAFPDSAEGHIRKAEILANAQRYSEADAVYDNYLKRHGNQSEDVLFSRARLIYACRQDASRATQLPESWSLDQALVYVRQANAASSSVGYRMHEAEILYAQKNYADALSIYKDLATKERNANLYAYACMCLEAMDSPKEEQLAMADSAVACYQKPYPTEAAQYLYLRSTIKRSMNQMREAVKDLNEYEHLMQGRLTEQFYYERMQMELSTRMYQQAIDDINKAIQLNPREPVYRAEYAALLYRINEFEPSIQQCEETLALEPNFPDAYRIWGLCLRRQGNSAAAKEKLRKAQELGDELAAKLMEEIDKE